MWNLPKNLVLVLKTGVLIKWAFLRLNLDGHSWSYQSEVKERKWMIKSKNEDIPPITPEATWFQPLIFVVTFYAIVINL